jgi:hypothetical protein
VLTRTDADDPHRATLVAGNDAFGTVSSSLLALASDRSAPPVLLFAAGAPGSTAYQVVRSPWDRPARVESA